MSSFDSITPRHMELLAAVVKNLKSTDVDWETVAVDANYTTAKYARDEYAKAWKKLQSSVPSNKDKDSGNATEDGIPAAATTTTTTPKTRKRKAASEKTPTKGKKAKKSEAAVTEAAEDEETQVKPEPQADENENDELADELVIA